MENKKLERDIYIAKLLDTLSEYWYARPHLRLSQIVSNAWHIHPDYRKNPEPDIQDVYYFTDEKFLEGLDALEKNESKGSRPTEG
jgi:hypothetical protein